MQRITEHAKPIRAPGRNAHVVLGAAMAAALAGCVPSWPQADWSNSTQLSTKEVLRFMAPADCTTPWPFDPTKTNYFYEVISLRPMPSAPGMHVIEYQDMAGSASRVAHVVQWWTAVKTVSDPLGYGSDSTACVLLVDIPKAKDSRRPYFVPNGTQKEREYAAARTLEGAVLLLMLPSIAVFVALAWLGCEQRSQWSLVFGSAIALVAGSIVGVAICIHHPWSAFEVARSYWAWFDTLPRSIAWLAPIETDQFRFLLNGPPNGTELYAQRWAAGVVIAWILWMLAASLLVRSGLYWLVTPLPLEALFKRAEKEGRPLRPEELNTALAAAVTGKRPWQITVMRRKAESFMRRFRPILHY